MFQIMFSVYVRHETMAQHDPILDVAWCHVSPAKRNLTNGVSGNPWDGAEPEVLYSA